MSRNCPNCQYFAQLEDGVICNAFHAISNTSWDSLEQENNCPDFKGKDLLTSARTSSDEAEKHSLLVSRYYTLRFNDRENEEQTFYCCNTNETHFDFRSESVYLVAFDGFECPTAVYQPKVETVSYTNEGRTYINVYYPYILDQSSFLTFTPKSPSPYYSIRSFSEAYLELPSREQIDLSIYELSSANSEGSIFGLPVNQTNPQAREEAIRSNIAFFEENRDWFESNGYRLVLRNG